METKLGQRKRFAQTARRINFLSKVQRNAKSVLCVTDALSALNVWQMRWIPAHLSEFGAV